MCVTVRAKLLQSCLTAWDTMDCSPPGSSVHGIHQAIVAEWVVIPSSRESYWPRDQTLIISSIVRQILHPSATLEAHIHMCSVSSFQFSHSVISNSLQPHDLQHARPPCPSPTPRIHSNSCPLSQWCHPAISSSVVPFSSCSQSSPSSGTFPKSQFFTWAGQSIGVSALPSALPMNTHDWSLLEWTGWTSLQSKGLSSVFSNSTVQKYQLFGAQLSSQSNSHIHTWPLKNHTLDQMDLCRVYIKSQGTDILDLTPADWN